MMGDGSGLRIRHTDPQVRGCTLMIPAPRKDLHIHVDGSGHSEVAKEVWEDLELSRRKGVPHGFEIANVVKKAPDLFIGLGKQGLLKPTKVYINRKVLDAAPSGSIVTRKR